MCIDTIIFIKEIVTIVATIIATIVAIWGINSWKRQSKAHNDHELAKRILVNLFKYRDAIANVRNPFMWSSEMPLPSEEDKLKMNMQDISFYGKSKAYQGRFNKVQEVRSGLYIDLIEAQALWGNELQEVFNELYKLQNELLIVIQNYIELINPKTDAVTKSSIQVINKDKSSIMYDLGVDNPDPFRENFDRFLKKIEEYLKLKMLT